VREIHSGEGSEYSEKIEQFLKTVIHSEPMGGFLYAGRYTVKKFDGKFRQPDRM